MRRVNCRKCGEPMEGKHTRTIRRKNGSETIVVDRRCGRCEALRQRSASRNSPRTQFVNARSIATRRGFKWLLTEEEYAALRLLPCDYCGFPLPKTGMGIDRVKSDLGYLAANVVPCCAECNVGKNANFTYEEMKLIGAVVAIIKKRRRDEGRAGRKQGRPRKYADDVDVRRHFKTLFDDLPE